MKLKLLLFIPLLVCRPSTAINSVAPDISNEIVQPFNNPVNRMVTTIQLNSLDSLLKSSDIVVIDFWFSGCGSCRKSMPELNGIYDEFSARKVKIYGVNPIDDIAKIEKIKTTYAVKYPLVQVTSEVTQKYRVEEYPLLFIFQKGKAVLTIEGYSPLFEKQVKDKLNTLVK